MAQTDFAFGFNAAVANDTTGECMGNVYCERCKRRHGYCHDINEQLTGIKSDAGRNRYTNPGKPYASWWADQTNGENMDLGKHYDNDGKKGGGKGYKRRPFLKAADIPKNGASAKIIDFRDAPKQMEYSDFLCDILIGKKEFTWGLRSKTVTLNQLVDELGKRTEKWIGKTVKLVRGGPKGQYVNLA